MTISTSSSADRRRFVTLLLPALVSAGCGQAEAPSANAPGRPVATAAATPRPAPSPAKTQSLSALYTADLTRAVAGEKKVAFAAKGAVGGMACAPAAISGRTAASRALTLTLPQDAEARAHVLAVVTPERGLLEIYSPDHGSAEAEDLIVPSDTISWSKARTQHRFATTAEALDGLRPGSDTPETLFLEAGRYRFALVNGIDAELLRANGSAVKVEAACSFDWTP
jgi:hypothetical protein